MTHVEDLKRAISMGRAVAIVGAGASIYATEGDPVASWTGLLRAGAQFCTERLGPSRWSDLTLEQISAAEEECDADMLISAASTISTKIRKIGPQAYATWLKETVGALPLHRPELAKAIHSLGCQIYTTNYDRLIERAVGAEAVDWTRPSDFQGVTQQSGAVGHLHGVFDRPDTVVLSEADYEKHQSSEAIQALQRALSATNVIVYIGCGGTFDDPNFTRLLDWHRRIFSPSAVTHYRLCRSSEMAAAVALHANDNIACVEYGTEFDDLPRFLSSIAPKGSVLKNGVVRDFVSESRDVILDEVRATSLIVDGFRDLDEAMLDELLIPPVILPVAHANFVRAKNAESESERDAIKRLDPDELARSGDIVLVAEPRNGLTTALHWLLERAIRHTSRIGMYLDYRHLGAGPRPLEAYVRKEALKRGILRHKNEELPPLVLAIDNFGAGKTGTRVAQELAALDVVSFIGCSSDTETAVTELLSHRGNKHRNVHLGRLELKDIRDLINLTQLAPTRSAAVMAAVRRTLTSHHLPRTPLTVALLTVIMSRGEKLVSGTSTTAILDQFVDSLLGRDEVEQDPTREMTLASRGSVLTDFAALLVESDSGSVKQSQALERMERFFQTFGWVESPAAVLGDLVDRRVLIFRGDQVAFSQSSFLHLFAAKAAMRSSEIRAKLKARPVYYATVLRAYGALSRNDADMLRRLLDLVDDLEDGSSGGQAYAELPGFDLPAKLEEFLTDENVDIPAVSDEEQSAEIERIVAHPFDSQSDSDVLPFPETDEDELPRLSKLSTALGLAAAFLRDGDEIADLSLKQAALRSCLVGLGRFVSVLDEDRAFQEAMSGLVQAAFDKEATSSVAESLLRAVPFFVLHSFVVRDLASRRLLVPAEAVIRDEDLTAPELAIPLATLLMCVREPGWLKQVRPLLERFIKTTPVQDFFFLLLFMQFAAESRESDAESEICDLLGRIYVARMQTRDRPQLDRVRSAFMQKITRMKAVGQLEQSQLDD